METFVKWFVESMSLIHFVSIFVLTALCYVFAPDALLVRLAADSPEFAPPGTLGFVLFFGGSFLFLFAVRQIGRLFYRLGRRLVCRLGRKRRIEQSLLDLSEDEQIYLFVWAQNGFCDDVAKSGEPALYSLQERGLVGRRQYVADTFYVLPEVRAVLANWLATGRHWAGALQRMR